MYGTILGFMTERLVELDATRLLRGVGVRGYCNSNSNGHNSEAIIL